MLSQPRTVCQPAQPAPAPAPQPPQGFGLAAVSLSQSQVESQEQPEGTVSLRYIQMTIELTVEDRAGNRTTAVRRAVKLYPNQLCGFSY